MKKRIDTILYNKLEHNLVAFEFLKSIMSVATLYLFGGGVRDLLDNKLDSSRDLDFVVECDSTLAFDIEKYIPKPDIIMYTKNRFGGYKITFPNDLIIDIWNLNDTWAFKTNKLEISAKNLTESVYLNIDGLAYSVNDHRFVNYCDHRYKQIKKNGILDIVFEENPFEELNLLRALVLKRKYSLSFSKDLKKKFSYYLSHNYDVVTDKFMDLQMSHYHSEVLKKEDVCEELLDIIK